MATLTKNIHTDALDEENIDHNVDVNHLVNNGAGMYGRDSDEMTNEEKTLFTETGTRLSMGTENDMEELFNTDFRDPGAGKTLQDSEMEEEDA